MSNSLPLVSCIMPTANREKFIPHAIRYFQRQDYPNMELVILDDGADTVARLLPDDKRINHIRLEQKLPTVGYKRNYACNEAKGDIIVHLDDDDWYANNWVSTQVSALLNSSADICGLRELYFYSPSMNKCWKYVYPLSDRPWVAGATMAYTKEFWKKHPFQNLQVGEDNNFVWFSGGRVAALPYVDGFVSILHPGNTSPKHITNVRWEPSDVKGISDILKNDFSIY